MVETWQRFVQGLLGVLALVGALVMAHYYAPPETTGLEQQVHQLSRQVADLERQQSFSAAAVDDARDSVAYIYGIYHVSGRAQSFRARVAGNGFVVAPGLLATNRHVAEPWYGDREVAVALRQGGTPVLEKLVAYFPGSPLPVNLETAVLATHGDLAVLRLEATAFTKKLRPLTLSADAAACGRVGERAGVSDGSDRHGGQVTGGRVRAALVASGRCRHGGRTGGAIADPAFGDVRTHRRRDRRQADL